MPGVRLTRLAGDYVTLVQALAASGGRMPAPDALRATLLELLDAFAKSAGAASVSSDQIEEARFALVAWADERIQKTEWAGRDTWIQSPLQSQLYRTNRAGQEFYEHLARLQPEALAALEVYWLVLALGFEGQYRGREPERRALIEHYYGVLRASRRLIETSREAQLSPGAYALDIALPAPVSPGVGLGVGVLALVLGLALVYGALWLVLRWQGGEIPLPPGA